MPYKIFAINLGSTSTKIAYYEDRVCLMKKSVAHKNEDLKNAKTIFDQYDFRRRDIELFMQENGIDALEMDAIVARGGLTPPLEGGVYIIDEDMLAVNQSEQYGIHPCSLGGKIAYDMCRGTKALPMTADLPATCEYNPLAFYSGMPDNPRVPNDQPLNGRANCIKYAHSIGRKYEDMNIIVSCLGGGITATAHEKGRITDSYDGVVGDGCFSNNRCNSVPVGPLVDMCFSGKYTYEEMKEKINGNAGLMGYLGVMDMQLIEKEALAGNQKYAEVVAAMCYQIAKDIGAMATVMKGKVDAILFVGGMANSKYITDQVTERVSFIAPAVVIPGELEMESLCCQAYRALAHQTRTKVYKEGVVHVPGFNAIDYSKER